MKGRGVIFKLGNKCIVIAKDETKHIDSEKATNVDVAKTAISAILLQSSRTDSDYYLHDHAEKINKIAKNSKNASTRAYAINALAKILSRTTSNYYASKISEYIEELA